VTLLPKTNINLEQTLPDNFVFSQSTGSVQYTNATDKALGVRSHHILVQTNKGSFTLTVKEDSPFINVNVKEGTAEAAFNDTENVSQLVTIPAGKELFFDDDKRTVELK
jgi:hypothetical protein